MFGYVSLRRRLTVELFRAEVTEDGRHLTECNIKEESHFHTRLVEDFSHVQRF